MLKTLLLALLIASLTSGCQSLQQRQSKRQLEATLNAYAAAIRWGHPGQAYSFLDPALEQSPQSPERLANVRVTSYKVVQPPVMDTENKAQQTVAIQYVFIDRQVERSILDQQLWRYDQEMEKWIRFNPVPEYR